MYVTMRISYIIQFQDPDKYQSVPLPISTRKTRAKKRMLRGHAGSHFQTPSAAQAAGMLAMLAPMVAQPLRRALGIPPVYYGRANRRIW